MKVTGQGSRATRRGKGRPARDRSAVGREALIAATGRLLKRRSPDQITRAELSREAGIDPALVRYYFGDMASLLTEGMIGIFDELQSRRASLAPDAGLREQLRLRISSLMEVLEAQPHLHQLLMMEVLHVEPARVEQVEALRRDFTLDSLDSFRSVIARAQDEAESVDVDVGLLYIVTVGMAEFAVKCFQYFKIVSAMQGSRQQTLARFADFVADLLVDGLRPRG